MPQTTLLSFVRRQPVNNIHKEELKTVSSICPQSVSSIVDGDEKKQENVLHTAKSNDAVPTPQSLTAIFATENEVFVPVQCPEAAVVRVRKSMLPSLKSITNTLLPVRYPDKFFDECIQDNLIGDVCRVLLWNSKPVGWIRCRLEPVQESGFDLYIQALGVLAPYRGLGLAAALFERVTLPQDLQNSNVKSAYAHVWEPNTDAIEWYEKRGFKRVYLQQQYYRRLKPAGAWVMRKHFN